MYTERSQYRRYVARIRREDEEESQARKEPMADNGEFTCAHCGETFPKGWSDEEAWEEAAQNFSAEDLATPQAVICDDCYQKFMKWWRG